MFATKVTRGKNQTREQFERQVAAQRRDDAYRRMFNDMIGFWPVCRKRLCRRNHGCSHDMHACFALHWPRVPEDKKEYLRGCVRAAKTTRSPEAIHRGGLAAVEDYAKWQARMAAMSAKHAAPAPVVRAQTPEPDVRVRRL
ncbi:MAG: hypothetical protein ACRD5L_18150 [Bryobacteraceae bacterium]